jgi:transcriptional regulator with XRE-family HTH domain
VANIQSLDPTASPLDYYGWELRRQREAHGLKQGQLGDIIFCTGSLIGQIETTKKVPTRDFSERVDAALGTDGLFSRLIGLVLRSQLPNWFQPYAEMEARATYISTYRHSWCTGCCRRRSTRGPFSLRACRTTWKVWWRPGWNASASWSANSRRWRG